MDEFELIGNILSVLGEVTSGEQILVGPGDDCAVTRVPRGKVVASSIDSLVADVHFPSKAAPELIGYRALAVNLSDLAAMGATPAYALLALTLPRAEPAWVQKFAGGVASICRKYSCPLVGGNIARGPLNITVSVHGFCDEGNFLLRSAAQVGDILCVTGELGAAGLALGHSQLEQEFSIAELAALTPEDTRYPLRRYYLPEPRLAIGQSLAELANAAIDLSDGLAADLGHICAASGVGARLEAEKIPLSPGCSLATALHSGDDYELCLTIAKSRWSQALERAAQLDVALHPIGLITRQKKVMLQQGEIATEIQSGGFQHFTR